MGADIPGAKNVLPRYSKPRVAGEPLGVHKPIGKRPPPSLKGGRLSEVLLGKEGLAYNAYTLQVSLRCEIAGRSPPLGFRAACPEQNNKSTS